MQNPFELIAERLTNIESLLIDLKHSPSSYPSVPPATDKPLTVEEAAKFLDLEPGTIYVKVHKGELPHSKKSGRLYFDREELKEYLKSGRNKTNSEIEAEAHTNITRKGK